MFGRSLIALGANSNTDWGYRFVAAPTNKAPNASALSEGLAPPAVSLRIVSDGQIVESSHPYPDNTDTFTLVNFVNASALEIFFDALSCTEASHDFVRFYCDGNHRSFFGLDKYHGGRSGSDKVFPGVGGRESLIIPGNSFVLHFHSDGRYAFCRIWA